MVNVGGSLRDPNAAESSNVKRRKDSVYAVCS